jgi:hypothetical protein
VSTILELREQAAERARALKEMAVSEAQGKDQRPEIRPTVQGWRGSEPVVVMMPAQVDRDQGLKAAWLCATGFGCDALAFTVDTWGTNTRLNPVTGKRWGPGEMQEIVQHHQGLEKGWIRESLSTFVVNRAGDLVSIYQGFRLTQSTSALGIVRWGLEWTEVHRGDLRNANESAEGVVPESLLRYMNEPTMAHHLARTGLSGRDFGLDDVEAQAHADCAVVRSLRIWGGWEGAMLLLSDDPRRAEIVQRSLGEMGLENLL